MMGKKGKNRKSWQKHLERTTEADIEAGIIEKKPKSKIRVFLDVNGYYIRMYVDAILIIIVVIAIRLLAGSIISEIPACSESYQSAGLDVIELYEVDAAPYKDGTLNISYRIVWKVLDGDSQGPLTWVNLGLANKDCELLGLDGAASSCEIDGYYAKVTLDREYGTGETVDLGIAIHQRSMLCRDSKDADRLFYRFTPGWFNNIEVKRYRFSWKDSGGILSADNDTRDGDMLIWEGSFVPGERREMTVYYSPERFAGAETVKYTPARASSGAPSINKDSMAAIIVIIIVGFLLLMLIDAISSYHNGSGFRPGGMRRIITGGRGYHGGGHQGCACAGCACACACAGGGRAGCSVKDYYDPERDG